MNRIPAWASTGAGDWQKFIQDHGIEHMTLRVDGDRINDLIAAALSVKGPDGTPYLKRGDIIWFWASPLAINPEDGLPARGQMVLQSVWDDCHVGIYWPSEIDRNRWWDSIGICGYQQKAYLRNDIHGLAPAAQSFAMTIVKTG